MRIGTRQFSGMIPKQAEHLLPDEAATNADNCDLQRGSINPRKEFGTSVGSVTSGNKTIYRKSDGTWLTWADDVDVVQSPVYGSTKLYYTGDGAPKVTDGAYTYPLGIPAPTTAPTVAAQAKTSTGWTITWHWFYEEPDATRVDVDVSPITPTETTVGEVYTLAAIPAKVSASPDAFFVMWMEITDADGVYLGQIIPTPSLTAGQTDAVVDGALVTGALAVSATAVLTLSFDVSRASDYEVSRVYLYTYLRRWGDGQDDEGPPSPVTDAVTATPVDDVAVTAIATAPTGYGITHVRIYRTVTGNAGTEYHYVAEIANGTSSYTDTHTDEYVALTDILQSTYWDPPPATLKSLRMHPGGFFVGVDENGLHCSEPYQPHAWPAAYIQTTQHTAVACGVVNNSIVVPTTGYPYLFTGTAPDALNPEKLIARQSCESKRSMVETGNAIGYASPDGVVILGGPAPFLMTEDLYTREQWRALNPATMFAAYHDQQAFIFHDAGTLIVRLDSGVKELTTTSDIVTGAFVDLATDTLYVAKGTEILPWGTGSARTAVYRSKYFRHKSPVRYACARVIADAYPVTLNVYAGENGSQTQQASLSVTSDEAFWLPAIQDFKEWSFEVETAYQVDEIVVVTDMAGLNG